MTTLRSFAGSPSDGARPQAGLAQASDGNFYGTTAYGGAYTWGTVFRITPDGTLTTLYSFCSRPACFDGLEPSAGLVQASDGNLYGTTPDGGYFYPYGGPRNDGNVGPGTVFKITPDGTLTTLHSFDGTDGAWPAGLVQATDGNFYGTTTGGGASNNCFFGCGTVFKITPSGTLTALYSFCSQSDCADGGWPQAALVQASDGNFYGTTSLGGSGNCSGFYGPGCGTVFKITPTGTLTTLHSFDITDGQTPNGLVQATDGNFYGTTAQGGAYCNYGCGTVFKITPSGTLTTLHLFDGTDGVSPRGALVQATDGNFYGTTAYGGANVVYYGTLFKITPSGRLTTLYSFCSESSICADDAYPAAGLVQASDGSFYGTTGGGGTSGNGTVFRLVLPRACIVCPSVE